MLTATAGAAADGAEKSRVTAPVSELEGAPPEDADTRHLHLRDRYTAPEDLAWAFERLAEELLELLANDGSIGARRVTALESLQQGEDDPRDNDAIRVMSTHDDKTETDTVVLRLTEPFEGGATDVFVLPEAARAYAVVKPDEGPQRLRTLESAPCGDHCTYSHSVRECSEEVCNSGALTCFDIIYPTTCAWEHFIRERYKVFACRQGAAGSYTCRELHTTVCTEQCCNYWGFGCACKPC